MDDKNIMLLEKDYIFPEILIDLASNIICLYRSLNLKLGTAESCTGGLLGGLITSIPGSSDIYNEGIISYSNDSKINHLNVNPELINSYGAVSEEVADAMVDGIISNNDVAISITGIAGTIDNQKDANTQKPTGLVYLSCLRKIENKYYRIKEKCMFGSIGRNNVRINSIRVALEMLLKIVKDI